jgi:hypothetical protein
VHLLVHRTGNVGTIYRSFANKQKRSEDEFDI